MKKDTTLSSEPFDVVEITSKPSWRSKVKDISQLASARKEKNEPNTSGKDEKFYSWLGWQVIIWGIGGLILWACYAPMDKGVSVPGVVIPENNRKTIQSAFAGIVDAIQVREGQRVQEGELLIKLNPISAQANSNATKESIDGYKAQSKGLQESIAQKRHQIALFEKQIAGARELVRDGYLAANKLLELERQQTQLMALVSEDQGNLIKISKQITELQEKLNPYEFDLANTEIKSPVDGDVVNLTVFTKGGVVSTGQKLMDISPLNDKLIVEAQLPVHLIDKVHLQLSVEMMFTAFNTNRTPHVPGIVIAVDSDRIVDEKTNQPYYKIQVTPTDEGIKLLGALKVRSGMPVELFIKTGEQSMMTYLLKPIFDRSHSAMRED
jgi:protease secretion system membrane fusion protein